MTEYHSSKIQNIIQKELFKATKSIKIAVAWLTNDLLFQPLLMKLQMGVGIELIINKDEINCGDENDVDFNEFESQGGVLHWNDTKTLLHDKFCIIDNNVIISGSYNWTNKAEYNEESIAVTRNDASALSFWSNKFAQLAAKYPASENSVAKRREIERKQEEERIRKEAELRRKQEEERRMLAYQQQQRIAVEKKRREEEAERARQEAERKKREELEEKEREKNEVCFLERPHSIWGQRYCDRMKKCMGLMYRGFWNSFDDSGRRFLLGLNELLISERNELYGLDTLIYYGDAMAYNPNQPEKNREYKRVLKFKTPIGDYRLFLTIEDFCREEVFYYQIKKFLRKKGDVYLFELYSQFNFKENRLIRTEHDFTEKNPLELCDSMDLFHFPCKEGFIMKDYMHLMICKDTIKIKADEMRKMKLTNKKGEVYEIELPVYRSRGSLNEWTRGICQSALSKDKTIDKIIKKLAEKPCLRISWKPLFSIYRPIFTFTKEKVYSWSKEYSKEQIDGDYAYVIRYYHNLLSRPIDYCIPELELSELC